VRAYVCVLCFTFTQSCSARHFSEVTQIMQGIHNLGLYITKSQVLLSPH